MHQGGQGSGARRDRIVVELSSPDVAVSHRPARERVSLARSRELVVARLLARGISPATLRVLLPERRDLIDRLAA